ncbi:uracil-DNA glycosylase family protein [Alkalicaulis satelles]|nr:hypothetical protein [Alkalicaulis satelles]
MYQLDKAEQARAERDIRAAFARWKEQESADLLERARKRAGNELEVSALMEPYVGTRYALKGKHGPQRIVILSADAGAADAVDFDKRREEFGEHFSALPDSPHLRGTLLALQSWFGTAELTIRVDGTDAPLMDCFAMLNATPFAISRPESGSNNSHVTPGLARRSAGLIKTLVEALQPNLVVAQGNLAWEALEVFRKEGLVWEQTKAASGLYFLPVAHPSARGKLSWSSTDSAYFKEMVQPGIHEARKQLGL